MRSLDEEKRAEMVVRLCLCEFQGELQRDHQGRKLQVELQMELPGGAGPAFPGVQGWSLLEKALGEKRAPPLKVQTPRKPLASGAFP